MMPTGNIDDMIKELSRPIEELADEVGVPRSDIDSFIDGVVSGELGSVITKIGAQVTGAINLPTTAKSEEDIGKDHFSELISELRSSRDPLLKELGMLIAESGDIDTRLHGCTGLQIACGTNLYYVHKFLLASADPDIRNDEGDTALHISCKRNDKEIAETLLDIGADPNIRNDAGLTPLHMLEDGNIDIRNSIRSSAKYRSRIADLHKILNNKNQDLSKILNDSNDDVELTCRGESLLHFSISRDDADMTKALIDTGAYLNTKNTLGETPLIKAVKYGKYKAIKYLVEAHADAEEPDNEGNTPSSLAYSKANKVFSKLLDSRFITKGFIKNIWQSGYFEFADLIEHENDIDAKDIQGYTIIHRLALTSDIELLELCIRYGADANATSNILKATPLMCAASAGNLLGVKALLEAGADSNLKTTGSGKIYSYSVKKEGMTAYDMAMDKGYEEVAEFLRPQGKGGGFLNGIKKFLNI